MDPVAAPMPPGQPLPPIPPAASVPAAPAGPMEDVAPPVPRDGVVGQLPAAPGAKPPLDRTQIRQELITTFVLLGVAVLVIGVIFAAVKSWLRRQNEDCDNPSLSLSSFRTMYENGELSEQEYEQIRNKMAAKMKGSLTIRPLPPAPEGNDVGRDGTSPTPENPS